MKLKGQAFLKKIRKTQQGVDRALYKLSPGYFHPSMGVTDHVLISRVKMLGADVPFKLRKKMLVDETVMFASNQRGHASWEHELGKFNGFLTDAQALQRIGYEISDIALKPETRKHFGDIIENL